MPNYLDLFAGAGGLSEGFLQAGYTPVAHIEMDEAACYTLKTRVAAKWLKDNGQEAVYNDYLNEKYSRNEFYSHVPEEELSSVLQREISRESLPEIFSRIDERLGNRELDLIVGGPPCQAYSLAGRSRSKTKMRGDKRNYLYKLYAEFLKRYTPKFFVFENVTGLLSAKDEDGKPHFEKMRDLFCECGYSTNYSVLNAKDYGVLQNRKRIILVGKRNGEEDYYPKLTQIHTDCVVGEIFSDLPHLHAGEGSPKPTPTLHYEGKYLYEAGIKREDLQPVTLHYARPNTEQDLKIYRLAVERWTQDHQRIRYTDLPKNLKSQKNTKSFLDRFKVVAADEKVSQTVVAHICKDGHYYIHPDIEQNRSLTPREAARLQTFPDDYFFECIRGGFSRTTAYKQIGNAVPVRLAYCIAQALLPEFEEE